MAKDDFQMFSQTEHKQNQEQSLEAMLPFRDPPVQEMPVQSMITHPSPHDVIAAVKSGCEYTDIIH